MKNYIKLSLLVLCVFFAFSCTKNPQGEAGEQMKAPDFILTALNQASYTLSDYRNKNNVILFFWTTWCPYCRKELQVLERMYPQLSSAGFSVFAIDTGESASKVSSFLSRYKVGFPVLLDKDASVANAYDIVGIPTYIIVDKQGVVVYKGNYFPESKYKELVSK